ncbi:MAG: CHAD domain-containing protein [Thermoleophilaceae bacterium]
MSYRIELHEGVASGIRRAVADELEQAVAEITRTDGDLGEAVHEARKRLKKARSAMRLVRFDLPAKTRARENDVLRATGRKLSGVRDAEVLIETLDELQERADGQLPATALRSVLEKRLEELRRHSMSPKARQSIAADLEAERRRSRSWRVRDENFRSAGRGLEEIHRRGRRAMKHALEMADDASWHEFRKRVKDLWYAIRLLRPIAPAQLGGIADEAKALSDLLGKINDVAVLGRAIDEHADSIYPGDANALRKAVQLRRDELRRAALPVARRLYDEPSELFAKRIGRWWGARDLLAAVEAEQAKRAAPKPKPKARGVPVVVRRRPRLRRELQRLGISSNGLSDRLKLDGRFSVGDLVERSRKLVRR